MLVCFTHAVIPAKAGIQQVRDVADYAHWIPAFAGMTAYRTHSMVYLAYL